MDQTHVINLRGLLCYIYITKKTIYYKKHNITSFKIIWEKWHNTARYIDIDVKPILSVHIKSIVLKQKKNHQKYSKTYLIYNLISPVS